jgi:hypothetical protein
MSDAPLLPGVTLTEIDEHNWHNFIQSIHELGLLGVPTLILVDCFGKFREIRPVLSNCWNAVASRSFLVLRAAPIAINIVSPGMDFDQIMCKCKANDRITV